VLCDATGLSEWKRGQGRGGVQEGARRGGASTGLIGVHGAQLAVAASIAQTASFASRHVAHWQAEGPVMHPNTQPC
jgi:hypothetical protein